MPWYNGKQGRWITTETGTHIFIENGRSVEEVIKEVLGDDSFDINYRENNDYKPAFDNSPNIEIDENSKEAIKICKNRSWEKRKTKFYDLGNLIDPDASYSEKIRLGKELYYKMAEKEGEEFLKSFVKQKEYDYDETLKNSNLSEHEFFEKYIEKNPATGNYRWKPGVYSKELYKELESLQNNCQRCVIACLLNWMGYKCKAKPSDAKGRYNNSLGIYEFGVESDNKPLWEFAPTIEGRKCWYLSGLIIPEGTKFDYKGQFGRSINDTVNDIKDIVEKSPDKTMFFCETYEKNSAHVFAIVNDNGKMRVMESQDVNPKEVSLESKLNNRIIHKTKLIKASGYKFNGDLLPLMVERMD